MPRRPRIDMVGYYHIVNRGVEQRIVYKDKEDFTMFLNLLCSGCLLYDVALHGYVLMSNHNYYEKKLAVCNGLNLQVAPIYKFIFLTGWRSVGIAGRSVSN